MNDTITWRKNEPGDYSAVSAAGQVVATVYKSGVSGRDDYPWSYYLAQGVEPADGRPLTKVTGATETMSEARQIVEWLLREDVK